MYPSEQPAGSPPPPDGMSGPPGVPAPGGMPGSGAVPEPAVMPGAPEPGMMPGAPGPGMPEPGGFPGVRPDWRRLLPQSSARPWRRTLAAGLGAGTAVAVLGVLLGLAWAWLAPTVPVVSAGDTAGVLVTDPSPEQYIAADGWFTMLGLGFGLTVAVGAWLALRRDRGPFLLLGVVAGAYVAGRWTAPAAGQLLGRDAYEQWIATAARGATYLAPPEVQASGPKLVPAFVAAIVLTLLAGWSNDPDLDLPGAQPGYGPNHAYPPPYEAPPPYAPQTALGQAAGSPYAPPATGDPEHPPPASVDPAGSPYAPPADPAGSSYGSPPADPTAAPGTGWPPPPGGTEPPRRDS